MTPWELVLYSFIPLRILLIDLRISYCLRFLLKKKQLLVMYWHLNPLELFHKLFRQDLLVASLFRNFLLAERVMRSYNCTPVSSPRLPPTYMHRMW